MRAAALLSVGILLVLLQSNLYLVLGPLGLHGATPSLVLPVIIFLGVHEPSMARGAVLAFALGHALDLMASAPMWLFTFVSVAVWWLARVAEPFIYVIAASGAVFGTAFGLQILCILCSTWCGRRDEPAPAADLHRPRE